VPTRSRTAATPDEPVRASEDDASGDRESDEPGVREVNAEQGERGETPEEPAPPCGVLPGPTGHLFVPLSPLHTITSARRRVALTPRARLPDPAAYANADRRLGSRRLGRSVLAGWSFGT